MKVGYLITARLKSTRLPEKLLREVEGKPILSHMLDRLKRARRLDKIIICTSTNPQDDRLIDLARTEGVDYYRGDEEDVLHRLHDAVNHFGLDYILNITADCPFVDPEYADRIVEAFEDNNADLIQAFDLPHGAYSYGIKPSALAKVIEIKNDVYTEVWGRYFTDTDLFEVYDLPIENPLHRQPQLRMTLDYPEDLEFFKAVFATLYKPGEVFSLDEILLYLQQHPEVIEINQHGAEAFKKRFTRQSEIALKPRYPVKRAAIIGCGSIGQRHIRNLHFLEITEIYAHRTHQGYFQEENPEMGVHEVADLQELLDKKPDIAVISNPTSLHLETAHRLLPHVRGLFIEKPLSHSMEGVSELLEQVKKHRTITFIGYNLQFHPIVRQIDSLLQSDRLGQPLVFQGQVGHWLPDWHPYEDHRKAYTACSELGGGVSLTLIHEVHLALQLLGPIDQVACFLGQYEDLPLEVDVISDMMLKHNNGATSQIHLDFIQRPYHRSGVISCEHGWIRYDFHHPKVLAQFEHRSAPEIIYEGKEIDSNEHYIDEMSTFLQYVREGRYHHEHDAWQGAQSLAVVMAAFESARTSAISKVVDIQ